MFLVVYRSVLDFYAVRLDFGFVFVPRSPPPCFFPSSAGAFRTFSFTSHVIIEINNGEHHTANKITVVSLAPPMRRRRL